MVQVFNEEPEKVEVQIMPAGSALAALTKGEIDMQIATAKEFPRSVAKFRNKALSLAMLNKKVARSCRYRLPRAGKMIEGASVRLLEIAASSWGNCRVTGTIVGIEEKYIHARGTFIDLENNYAVGVDVFRRITKSDGTRYNDDMIMTNAMAAVSIARRNAIIAGVPRAYIDEMSEEIKKFTEDTQELSLEEERKLAFDYITKNGIPEQRILDLLGKASVEDVTFAETEELRALCNAVKDGMTTWQEAFPDLSSYGKVERVSADDILKNIKAKSSEKEPEKVKGSKTGKEEKKTSEPAKNDKEGGSESKPDQSEDKKMTPKQKQASLLLPILLGNPSGFEKACLAALGGKPDFNLDPETLLNNFTMKELQAIDEEIKNPSPVKKEPESKPESQQPETPSEEKEPSEPKKKQDLTPSETSEPEKAEIEEAKPSEADSEDEKAKLAKAIKEHPASLEEKIAIISDCVGEGYSDQVLSDMADSPESIDNVEQMKSILNILDMMG